jgi:hypothetical protein
MASSQLVFAIFGVGSDRPGVHHMGARADFWFLWWAVEDAAQWATFIAPRLENTSHPHHAILLFCVF